MIKCWALIGWVAVLLLVPRQAGAEDKEPSAIIEIGGAGEWGVRDGVQSFGPALSLDVTPLKDWLEIEAGVTSQFGGGTTQWETDIVFKKPFTLSHTAEVEIGVGPAWMHAAGGGKTSDSLGGEAVVEFEFWPWPERNFGWYLEPSYGYDFGAGHGQSLGVTVGLLIAIP
jgi:hypothetical protein